MPSSSHESMINYNQMDVKSAWQSTSAVCLVTEYQAVFRCRSRIRDTRIDASFPRFRDLACQPRFAGLLTHTNHIGKIGVRTSASGLSHFGSMSFLGPGRKYDGDSSECCHILFASTRAWLQTMQLYVFTGTVAVNIDIPPVVVRSAVYEEPGTSSPMQLALRYEHRRDSDNSAVHTGKRCLNSHEVEALPVRRSTVRRAGM